MTAAAHPLPGPIASLFNECQKSLANHAKTSKALFELEKKAQKTFGAHFIAAVDRALIVPGREPAVERFIKFIVLYSCSPGRSVLERLLRHLVPCSKADNKHVRFRSCHIMSSLIHKLAENNAQLDASVADLVKDALLLRTKDKSASVRAEATVGLSIFQAATVADDVFDQYVRLLDDQQKEVRVAALNNICLSKVTLAEVMKRTRDADENIRQETFKVMQKIPFQRLSVEQRVDIVRNGLGDASKSVRDACLALVQNHWLPVCNQDLPTLVGLLDVEEYEECAEILLRSLLQSDTIKVEPFGKKNVITASEAIFWRLFAEQIKTRPAESRIDLEELLPGMELMKGLLQKNRSNEFICRQLLLTCAQFDPGADELGCRDLCSLLEHWVCVVSLGEEMRVHTCRALAAMLDGDTYKRFILNAIREFSTESIDTLTVPQAAPDSPGWPQCITLVEELFASSKDLPAPLISDVIRNIILPLITLHDPAIRNRGIKCLGLACTLSEKAVQQYGEVFVQAIQNDMASVRQTAMKALFDIIMVWGTKVVSQCSTDPLAFLATNLSPTTQDALRRIAVEGFVKLLVSDTVRDEKILAQLLVLHFEMRDDRPSVMKRCLQTFFDAYSRWSHRNQSIITKAYVSTIHAIIRAAPSSNLKKVKPVDVTLFIAALTNPSLIEKKQRSPMKITSYHNQLALAIASEVHTSQRLPEVEEMLKVLPTLQLNKQDTAPLVSLAGIVKSLQNRTLAEPVKKALAKLVSLLKDLSVELPAEATPEPTNPRPVDKKKRTLPLGQVPNDEQQHLASLDAFAFDEEDEKPARKRFAGGTGQKLCGNCKKALAAWHCQQCTDFLCNGCLQTVHSAPILRKHVTTPYPSSPKRPAATTPKKDTIIMESNSPEVKVTKSRVRSPVPLTPEPKKARIETSVLPAAPSTSLYAPKVPYAKSQPSTPAAPPRAAPKSAPPGSAPTPATDSAKRPRKDIFDLNFSDEEVEQKRSSDEHSSSPHAPHKKARGDGTATKMAERRESDVAPEAVKVSFSGITDTQRVEDLCKMIMALGGAAHTDAKGTARLSLKDTHLVVDNVNFRRLKTVIAALLGMWIVTPQWVIDSANAGCILHEAPYGRMHCSKPHVAGKSFFLSPNFKRDARYNAGDWQTLLVRVGEGKIVDSAGAADYVLVADGERVQGAADYAQILTWAAAMEMMQPLD